MFIIILTLGGANMPNFDGTGPRGKGPGSGRGRGKCKGNRKVSKGKTGDTNKSEKSIDITNEENKSQ
jgi:hypothetical protein